MLWITVDDTFDPTSPYAESAVATASFILFKLSGEKYTGTRISTDSYNLSSYAGLSYIEPAVARGEIYNVSSLTEGFRNLKLRHQPVMSVQSVEYLGRVLTPDEYTLRNKSYLVRKHSMPWILDNIQDLTVTYTHGTPPPTAGKRAAIRLANELILSDMGSGQCALPERITSVNRQGISYTVMDPQEFIDNGKVGIYEVDLFLAAVNPHKAKKRPKVFSVDRPRGERIN